MSSKDFPFGHSATMMFGRGSPKINLMQDASVQRNSSPRSGGRQKKRSPKGKTAEGKLTFISVQSKENDEVRIVQPPMEHVTLDGAVGSLAFLSSYNDGHQHDDMRICTATSSKRDAPTSSRDKRVVVKRDEESTTSRVAKGVKVGQKRKQNGDVAEMMGRYLELKTKQTEEEVAEVERARAKTEAAVFSSRIAMLYWPQWNSYHVKRE